MMFNKIHKILTSKRAGPFTEVANRGNFNDRNLFYEMINGNVQEKFFIMEYHYENYCRVENIAVGIDSMLVHLHQNLSKAGGSSGVFFATRKLDAESESFILQMRACLDQFARSVGYYFETSVMRFGKLQRYLEFNRRGNEKARNILAIFNA